MTKKLREAETMSKKLVSKQTELNEQYISAKILAEKLQKQKKVDIKFKPIKGADHFYENFSNEFTEVVDKYIKENII